MTMAMHGKDAVELSTGNVFADLGLPDAEDRLAKAELARQIGAIIRERGLTQQAAAQALGIFLTMLGRDVQIVVRETTSPSQTGRLTVITA
jgi:predicted XRE-type DNA-binding protein